jgi:hypothetical protein
MTATATTPTDPRQDAINTVARLLIRLFDTSPQPFVITNGSVATLTRSLLGRINASFARGESDALFKRWDEEIPQFQQALIAVATQPSPEIAGRQLPIMTEQKALKLKPPPPVFP